MTKQEEVMLLGHYKAFLAKATRETGIDILDIADWVRRWENRCYRNKMKLLKAIKEN